MTLPQLLRDNYAAVASDLINPLLEFLSVGRVAGSGDLDRFLIYLVIALRTAQDKSIEGMRLEDVLSGDVEAYPSLHTNVRSVADSTGIPRETVRRKVADLIAQGWVVRRGDDLAITPLASQQLTPVRECMFEVAGRMHAVVEKVTRAPRRQGP